MSEQCQRAVRFMILNNGNGRFASFFSYWIFYILLTALTNRIVIESEMESIDKCFDESMHGKYVERRVTDVRMKLLLGIAMCTGVCACLHVNSMNNSIIRNMKLL